MVIDVDRSGFPHLMAVVGSTSIDADVDTVLGALLGEACRSGGQREAEKARLDRIGVFAEPRGDVVAGKVRRDRDVTERFVSTHLNIGIDALRELRDSGESVKHLRFE